MELHAEAAISIALEEDLERVRSRTSADDDDTIEIDVRTPDGSFRLTVSRSSQVWPALTARVHEAEHIWYGGCEEVGEDSLLTFEDLGAFTDAKFTMHPVSFESLTGIRVLGRIRPLQRREIDAVGDCSVLQVDGSSITITSEHFGQRAFTLHEVRTEACTQESLYRSIGARAVKACLSGVHACVMAYGQTGAGKSYTMGMLPPGVPEFTPGIIHHAASAIFDRHRELQKTQHRAMTVSLSALEVYIIYIYYIYYYIICYDCLSLCSGGMYNIYILYILLYYML